MPTRTPGSPEWRAHVAKVLAEEAREPEQWWYLSFVGYEGFRGACVVFARGMMGAIKRSHAVGCKPGGEVMAFPVGQNPGPYPVDKLLSKEELGPGAHVGELEDAGLLPGPHVEFADPPPPAQAFDLPSHCEHCGALLMGGATEHKPGCPWLALIAECFPKAAS